MTSTHQVAAVTDVVAQPLLLTDLLLDSTALTGHLRSAVAAQEWLDAFLLSAALAQLLEDRLHPDPLQLRRAQSFLGGTGSRPARVAAATAGAAAKVLGPTGVGRVDRRLLGARHATTDLCLALARAAARPGGAPPQAGELEALLDESAGATRWLDGQVVRLPTCFRDFDQDPDDVAWLAGAWLERGLPVPDTVCVVGVRTSGSYLAPLLAVALESLGVRRVHLLTHRPGRPFHPWERRRLDTTVAAGGRVLVIDDPPGTGTSLRRCLEAVEAVGVPRRATTTLVSSFEDSDRLPASLAGRDAVVQPWSQWSIHRRLHPSEVERHLRERGWPVAAVNPLDGPAPAGVRGHVTRRFDVELRSPAGTPDRREVLAQGVGLGYLGRHAVAVGSLLNGLVPPTLGFVDGVLYQEAPPGTGRPRAAAGNGHSAPADGEGAPGGDGAVSSERAPGGDGAADNGGHRPGVSAEAVADYVASRAERLPASADPTPGLRGRSPVWEEAASALSGPWGPLGPVARLAVLEPLVKSLTTCARPSVVDGDTRLGHWQPGRQTPARWVKAHFHERAFSNRELACYDPVYDLAGAAVPPPPAEFQSDLRAAYRRRTGTVVDAERWFLYRLAHLAGMLAGGQVDRGEHARLSAAVVHEYLRECFPAPTRHVSATTGGAICAIDLDGVLETDRLGCRTTSPAGVRALRSLQAHGFRVVLATGRSLDDVRERCTEFDLDGAVAEYGTVTYDHGAGVWHDQRTHAERELLERVRRSLTARGLSVDPGHRHVVRVRTAAGGPLPAEVVDEVPELRDPRLRVVQGLDQTDVCLSGLDKASGLARLGQAWSAPGVALAVGDSCADLGMLTIAELARAPQNADRAVRAATVPVTRGSYQSGLVTACGDLLGHRPGACPRCRIAPRSHARRAVLALLSLHEDGGGGVPVRALGAAALTMAWLARQRLVGRGGRRPGPARGDR